MRKGRLRKVEPDPEEFRKELQKAEEELSRARTCFAEKRYEDCHVQSYFAMFRSARILLRSQGYRDTNMYSLLAGLRKLFVAPGNLEDHQVEYLSRAKDQKDLVYEGARCNVQDTRALLRSSEIFCNRVREILALPDFPPIPPMEEQEPEEEEVRPPRGHRGGSRHDRRFDPRNRRPRGPAQGPQRPAWDDRFPRPRRERPEAFRPRETRPRKRD